MFLVVLPEWEVKRQSSSLLGCHYLSKLSPVFLGLRHEAALYLISRVPKTARFLLEMA
jgi:hypothetical protein